MHIQPLEQRRLLAASVEFAFAMHDADTGALIAPITEDARIDPSALDGPALIRATVSGSPGEISFVAQRISGAGAAINRDAIAPYDSRALGFAEGDYEVYADVLIEKDYIVRSPTVRFSVEPVSERPGPDNTGHEGELTTWTGPSVIRTPGLYENFRFNGNIRIETSNVTMRNCEFIGSQKLGTAALYVISGLQNVLIDHCTIRHGGASILTIKSGTVQYSHLYDATDDAIGVGGEDINILHNYITHPLGTRDGAHADGIQIATGKRVNIIGNAVEMPKGVPGTRSNACVMLKTSSNVVHDVLIQGNWFNGGNYTIYSENGGNGDPVNVQILDNRFGRDYRYGLLQDDGPTVWSGNVWDDTGEEAYGDSRDGRGNG